MVANTSILRTGLSSATTILSAGYLSALCSPRSGLERSDFVPWPTQDSPKLYDRLGGVYSIATVIDDSLTPVAFSISEKQSMFRVCQRAE